MALSGNITEHRIYLRAITLAAAYLKNPARLSRLLSRAQEKARQNPGSHLSAIREQLALPGRMLKAWTTGDYREIPWRSLLLITAAMIYFLMPVDMMPDLLPLLGYVDDLALLGWTLEQVRGDLERFRAWEGQTTGQAFPVEMGAPVSSLQGA